MTYKKIYILTALALGLLLAGCGAVGGQAANLDGTSWVLVSIQGKPVLPGTSPTLRFEGSQVSGNSTCNNFGGGYEISGGKLFFEDFFMTAMACADPDAMAQESAYMQVLGQAGEYQLEGDQLTLLIDGRPVLVFASAE